MNQSQLIRDVGNHLLAQNCRSEDVSLASGTSCKYKSASGLKCAVGCLISDADYKTFFESKNISQEELSPIVLKIAKKYKMPVKKCTQFLSDLQYLHDYFEPQVWVERLNILCEDNDIDYTFTLKDI